MDALTRRFKMHLRERRKAAGMSVAELHRRSGVSRSYLAELEDEESEHSPSLAKCRAISAALGVDFISLVYDLANHEAAHLLGCFAQCDPDSRAVVLSVCEAQAKTRSDD